MLYVDKLSVESIGTKFEEGKKAKKNVVKSSYCSSDPMTEKLLVRFLGEFEDAHHQNGCKTEMTVKFIDNED